MRMALCTLLFLTGCSSLNQVGKAPEFSALEGSYQHHAMYSNTLPNQADPTGASDASSLWTAGGASLLGDRRAGKRGDILTVVIEIDDRAEISNSSGRSRSGNQSMGMPQLMGLPQRINRVLPEGATMAEAVSTNSSSTFSGDGSVSRKEKLTLRVAATIVEELPNGVLRIEGQQEVRVNFEMRELIVTGYVRPTDVSRTNEVTYDKIAGARISYGGRGQITEVQQPRYGQQITDILLPF
ncbi:MAG: flagellar basal body L-ring protein FlgH [Pseudotabrizicola sp.]|uniref:flagellar basal body L-ring protein FlgH n=1 Tax=Pseudotabrizicola sp. TaxID=2939647 RepID=UPI00271AACED|nr:flagellar basal body L-ring protein FlgH [Pseudotabrizicola sp.]MDO8885264.1 flagellar basal body L-ring protein FlgH [Pseudotabrizicola sp.]MDP2081151.1 flagellar basal body L-ring protein FlgH [Pseudotabrizicola sp.]MDZ7575710.1 flagellar basal body L-ring protein FlgH [Pseudotabrizicola sp.]